MTAETWIRIGAVSAALAVGLGAFGAHGLRDSLTPERLDVWRTAAHYHLVHSVALVAIAAAAGTPFGLRSTSLWLILVGIVVFAGSLYALCLTDTRALGAVTPIGGLAFIAGWLMLLVPRASS